MAAHQAVLAKDRLYVGVVGDITPEELGPLKPVLEGAGHFDPEQRTDARALSTGLLRAAKELSRPSPLPLVGAVEAGAGWSRLTGDAAKSPITAQGSKDQYTLSFGVLRRFDIGF